MKKKKKKKKKETHIRFTIFCLESCAKDDRHVEVVVVSMLLLPAKRKWRMKRAPFCNKPASLLSPRKHQISRLDLRLQEGGSCWRRRKLMKRTKDRFETFKITPCFSSHQHISSSRSSSTSLALDSVFSQIQDNHNQRPFIAQNPQPTKPSRPKLWNGSTELACLIALQPITQNKTKSP